MVSQLDNFTTQQKQTYVIAATVIGLVLSTVSCMMRVYARMTTVKRLFLEDWMMLPALLLSYGVAACEFYGLSTGLGQHVSDLSDTEVQNFMFSVWLLQRFGPTSLFFVKTSIILFYVHIFPMRKFKFVAWGVWIFTLLWTIESFLSSMLECLPIAFFWDKTLEGSCVSNPLIAIGLTNGVLSCVGDIFIFCMPFPLLAKLRINQNSKYGLFGIFLVGLFVVCTSFVRWVALLGTIAGDTTFTQVEAGIWTYLEIAIGILCANLPLLKPIFRCLVRRGTSNGDRSHSNPIGTSQVTANKTAHRGFTRMDPSPTGSEVELQERDKEHDIIISTEIRIAADHHEVESVDENWKRDRVLGFA